jgi:hypothetical protein
LSIPAELEDTHPMMMRRKIWRRGGGKGLESPDKRRIKGEKEAENGDG